MFLTKKALKKIKCVVGVYIGTGIFCLVATILFAYFELDTESDKFIVILGALSLLLALLYRKMGRYAEGKGKLITQGNKLVCYELRPAEFIRLYEQARDCPDNVVSQPDFDVFRMVEVAYETMGENERMLETLEQMLEIAPAKAKPLAIILKSGTLFELGQTEEAEGLYAQVVNMEPTFVTRPAMEVLVKLARAMAYGDYTTAEAYCRQRLQNKFPKNTPLMTLSITYSLARICCKTNRMEEARQHLQYCVENGGETIYKLNSEELIKEYNL